MGKCQKEAKTRVEKNSCSRQCSSQLITELERNEKKMGKCYLSKKSFTYEIYAGTSKAGHIVFQQRGASSTREFSLLQNLQFFAWKLWLKIGCVFN